VGAVDADEFCREVWPRLVRSLASYTGDAALAEDLAQEALARALVRWRKVGAMDAPAMWVYRTAMNLARSRFRRRRAEARAYERVGVRSEDAQQVDQDAVLTVRSEIGRLPERQRAALVLRFHADLSVDETAAVMGCAPGTVKALTHQALERLRSRIIDQEEVEP
jgi:RNA polymerase sigma-70 factor (sigma-E family)